MSVVRLTFTDRVIGVDRSEDSLVARCVTCGTELHPERAEKYTYCTAPTCQEQNAKGLTMVAVGVNKAAEQYLLLDERTRADLADGKHHDPRRGGYGRQPGSRLAASATRTDPPRARAIRSRRRRPWSRKHERLALLYNQQGLRPDEIAQKLGVSRYTVTQILLDAKTRRKA
jgi:hypothetical protein